MYKLGGRVTSSSIAGVALPPRGLRRRRRRGHEEAFSLESSGPPAFAALVKLTPDLIDEIRRAEEAGSGARIKFNSEINPAENIIDVGGKKFNFTYTSEHGELCDIYEEHQSGEDGNGLLIECGSARRKLNVQPILDEPSQKLVKRSREEAERLWKSRKSIVLDPTNPLVKSQTKSMTAAAVEDCERLGEEKPC